MRRISIHKIIQEMQTHTHPRIILEPEPKRKRGKISKQQRYEMKIARDRLWMERIIRLRLPKNQDPLKSKGIKQTYKYLKKTYKYDFYYYTTAMSHKKKVSPIYIGKLIKRHKRGEV